MMMRVMKMMVLIIMITLGRFVRGTYEGHLSGATRRHGDTATRRHGDTATMMVLIMIVARKINGT